MKTDFGRKLLLLEIPELDEDAFQPRGRNSGMRLYGGKGGGGSAPAPDPAIGQAARENVQLGRDWLSFAKQQFEIGNDRQQKTDDLNTQVIQQQLGDQQKAGQRSDQQWNDYNTLYRPIERLNLLDAMGGQDLTDDQVKALIDKQNEAQRTQLQSQYDANVAAINGRSGSTTSTISGAGLSKEAATALADSILSNIQQGGQDQQTNPFLQYSAQAVTDPAQAAAKRQELIDKLTGIGSQDATKTTTTLTDAERAALLDAEKKRFDGQVAGLGNVTDQVMMQREAERNAEANAAATAKADVMANAEMQKQAGIRQMASMGVNPNSGRFAGIERATDLNTALASAGAQNNARTIVKNRGIALRSDQANYGRGGTSVAAQQVGLGTNSGNSAVQNNASGNANFYANNGVMTTGYGGAIGANNSAGSILSNLYGNQLSAWQAQQQANATSAAGVGSMVGTIAGAGITAF